MRCLTDQRMHQQTVCVVFDQVSSTLRITTFVAAGWRTRRRRQIVTAGARFNRTRRFADTNAEYVDTSCHTFDSTPASAAVADDDDHDDDDDDGSDVQ